MKKSEVRSQKSEVGRGGHRAFVYCLLSTVFCLLSCCGPDKPPAAPAPPTTLAASRPSTTQSYIQFYPQDPEKAPDLRICLDVYRVVLPARTVSASEDFWRRADEECVDQETHQRLYDNGMRIGRAPIQEWPYFRDLIAANPTTVWQESYAAAESKAIDIEMKKDVLEQTVFFFGGGGRYEGRAYDNAANFMVLSFQPAPRQTGSVRVGLCPLIRSTRRIMQWSPINNEERSEIVSRQPEWRYDMNLRADIPLNSFMIIAPSAEAKLGVSVGATFFLKDGPTQREETVILLVPRVYKWENGKLKPVAGVS